MNHFENKLSYNQISFYLSNRPAVTEREMHVYHELLYYIDGDVSFFTENGQQPLCRNTLLLIPRETYHCFRLENAVHFMRLKVSIPDSFIKHTPLSALFKGMVFIDVSDPDMTFILNALQKAVQKPACEKNAFYACNALMLLLSVLDAADAGKALDTGKPGHDYIPEIIGHISHNLAGDLRINTLAKLVNLSPSAITHVFKKELGIPLHEYITQKRLILAKSLILAGYKPTKIFPDCGFRDYSSFYKAYTQFFGYPPSKEG